MGAAQADVVLEGSFDMCASKLRNSSHKSRGIKRLLRSDPRGSDAQRDEAKARETSRSCHRNEPLLVAASLWREERKQLEEAATAVSTQMCKHQQEVEPSEAPEGQGRRQISEAPVQKAALS